MDLDAVRTFVAVADSGQFGTAATELSITQQAASKRVANLETVLGARLFARTPRGATLTADGRTFLPHARELLGAEARAEDSLRPGRSAAPASTSSIAGSRRRAFSRTSTAAIPTSALLDVLTIASPEEAFEAVVAGTVGRHLPHRRRPGPRAARGASKTAPAVEETHELLVRPAPPARRRGHGYPVPARRPPDRDARARPGSRNRRRPPTTRTSRRPSGSRSTSPARSSATR